MNTHPPAPSALPEVPSQFALAQAIAGLLPPGTIKTPRQFDALFKGAQIIASALAQRPCYAAPGMGLSRWLACDDMGGPPLYMAAVLFPNEVPGAEEILRRADFPHDANDFARCVRFLEAVPEAAGRLAEVADHGGPTWQRLVANWSNLTTLCLRTDGGPLTEHIRQIISAS